jgi:hypothetical protein
MLATWGFISTGIFFAIFALTFRGIVLKYTPLRLNSFTYAYAALAAAFVLWGVAAAINDPGFLATSVLIGNGLILLGTICMIDLVLPPSRRTAGLALAGATAVALFAARAYAYVPEPVMRDGILIFQTQAPVAAVLGLLFLCVWLPVNIRVARQVTHAIKQDTISQIYSYMYMTATVAALVFLGSRRPTAVVLSFVAITICFALLIGSNILVKKIKESPNGKHA